MVALTLMKKMATIEDIILKKINVMQNTLKESLTHLSLKTMIRVWDLKENILKLERYEMNP